MSKRNLKLISMVLAVIMIISLLPMAVLAENEDAGTGNVAFAVYGPEFTSFVSATSFAEFKEAVQKSAQGLLADEVGIPVNGVEIVLRDENGEETPLTSSNVDISRTVIAHYRPLFDISPIESFDKPLIDVELGILDDIIGNFDLKAIQNLNKFYTIYTATDVPEGDYTLVVKSLGKDGYLAEDGPGGARQYPVKVEKGKWTIAGRANDKEAENASHILDLRGKKTGKGLFLEFPGLWTKKTAPEFVFSKVDIAGDPVDGAQFILVNLDETKKIVKYLVGVGKDNFQMVVSKLRDEDTISWNEVMELSTQLLETNDSGELSIDYDTVQKLITTFVLFAADVVKDIDIHKDELKTLKIPAVLESKSEADGLVHWSEDNNITLTLAIKAMSLIIEELGNAVFEEGGALAQVWEAYQKIADSTQTVTEKIINNAVYPLMQRLGLVTKKLPTGDYILFESKAPQGKLRNPMYYTIHVTWKDDEWVYAECADIGVLMPYLAADYYTFLRNNSVTDATDKMIAKLLEPFAEDSDFDTTKVYSQIVNNDVDVTAEMILYMSGILYNYAGGSQIYASENALASDLMKVLYSKGRTTQNMMVAVNDAMTRTQKAITGELNEDWYYYNLEASIFKTWQKRLKAITTAMAESLVVDPDVKNSDNKTIQKIYTEEEEADTTKRTVSEFKDLNPSAWYYKAVQWCLTNGIMAGVTDTDFRVQTPVTRGMAVQILYAAAGKPEVKATEPFFTDVSPNRYYYKAIQWAKENGIVEGMGDGKFAPDTRLQRQQIAVILKAYCEKNGIEVPTQNNGDLASLRDNNSIADWARTGLAWAKKAGIMVGLTEDTMDPLDIVTRGQIAQMMYRILLNNEDSLVAKTNKLVVEFEESEAGQQLSEAVDKAKASIAEKAMDAIQSGIKNLLSAASAR